MGVRSVLGKRPFYEYVIALLWGTVTVVYLIHLFTGWMPDRVALRFVDFDFDVYWSGIFMVGGMLLGALVVGQLAAVRQRDAEDEESARLWQPVHVWQGLGYCFVLGVIGARLYHILTPPPSYATLGIEGPLDYFSNPYQLINLRGGGLGFYGALLGGGLGLWWYTRREQLPLWAWADLVVIGVAVGHSLGRWGNFFEQTLYGRPTALFWGIQIDSLYRLPSYSEFGRFHPAFLYEAVWNLLTFLLLMRLYRGRELKAGTLVLVYLCAYGVGRFLVELVRLDGRMVADGVGVSITAVVAVGTAVVAGVGLWLRR